MAAEAAETGTGDGSAAERPTRRRFLKLGCLALALGGAGYAGMSNLAEVMEYREPLPRLRGELRALVLSDLHLPSCFVSAETVLEAQRAFKPHVALIVGDAIDKRGNEGLVDYFASLQAPAGKFAVLGNWEYWSHCSLRALEQAYERAGVRLLVNEAAEVVRIGSRPEIALLTFTPSVRAS